MTVSAILRDDFYIAFALKSGQPFALKVDSRFST